MQYIFLLPDEIFQFLFKYMLNRYVVFLSLFFFILIIDALKYLLFEIYYMIFVIASNLTLSYQIKIILLFVFYADLNLFSDSCKMYAFKIIKINYIH